MARKTKIVTILDEGRDNGKVFRLGEVSAGHAEDWAIRAFMGMARSGAEIPEEIKDAGLFGVMALGLKALAGMAYQDAKPLLDELMACVQVIPDPAKPEIVRVLMEEDIEEVKTRLKLRKEVIDLHTNFSEIVARSKLKMKTESAPAD